MISPIRWDGERLWLLDQTRLPAEEVERACAAWPEVAEAIRTLVVRGAPAIGVAAAFGVALAARASRAPDGAGLLADLETAITGLGATRPTAVNLFWALDRMRRVAVERQAPPPSALGPAWPPRPAPSRGGPRRQPGHRRPRRGPVPPAGAHPHSLQRRRPGHRGLRHRPWRDPRRPRAGSRRAVWVDETRPAAAGRRLTAWELSSAASPTAHRRRRGRVMQPRQGRPGHRRRRPHRRQRRHGQQDRHLRAWPCSRAQNGIPFYVAAPDLDHRSRAADGAEIPIEERRADEVRQFGGRRTAPAESPVRNPAFDVTPARLITAIITERGVFAPRTPSRAEVALGPSASSDQERARWLSGVGRLPVRPPVDRVGSACIAYGGRSILEAWRPPCSGSP